MANDAGVPTGGARPRAGRRRVVGGPSGRARCGETVARRGAGVGQGGRRSVRAVGHAGGARHAGLQGRRPEAGRRAPRGGGNGSPAVWVRRKPSFGSGWPPRSATGRTSRSRPGETRLAIERFTEAIEESRVPGGAWARSHACGRAGRRAVPAGRRAGGGGLLAEALALAWMLHDRPYLARLFWEIAAVAARCGAARGRGPPDRGRGRGPTRGTGGAIWPLDREDRGLVPRPVGSRPRRCRVSRSPARRERAGSLEEGVAAAYADGRGDTGAGTSCRGSGEATGAPAPPPPLAEPAHATPDRRPAGLRCPTRRAASPGASGKSAICLPASDQRRDRRPPVPEHAHGRAPRFQPPGQTRRCQPPRRRGDCRAARSSLTSKSSETVAGLHR